MGDAFSSRTAVERYSRMVEEGYFDHEAEAVSYFGEPPGRVLDVGCGAGRTTRQLARAGFDVVGLDASPSMAEAATEFVTEPDVVVASADELPFDDRSFDHVLFSFNGLDYVPRESHRYDALDEIRRVLEPGGRFVFSSHNARYVVGSDPYNPLEFAAMLLFWSVNLLCARSTSRYKYDVTPEGLIETYYITPAEQRRQLRAAGFDHLETITQFRSDALLPIDPWPYYVAEKR